MLRYSAKLKVLHADRTHFCLYLELGKELLSYVGLALLWTGDFNCVLDGRLDWYPPRLHFEVTYDSRTARVMEHLQCLDFWRVTHPALEKYTYHTLTHDTHSRLDRFLITKSVANTVQFVDILGWFLSGHALLLLRCPLPTALHPKALGDAIFIS
ncbi:hypothetical protein NDU88_008416 [Pleurodeles waltl]|uniref:Uncharacterized protein n=1 Tax=Pleurodeles waltl TaxID=8319 RepID=A0AAV7PSU8_PLEWA|nr:hypothetical protein NDU88_008416 [Pleurodeles waltl]